jgi:hypothetical protein
MISTEVSSLAAHNTCSTTKLNNLKDVIGIVRSPTFFMELGVHLDALLPTIEASIVMQGGSVTLAGIC